MADGADVDFRVAYVIRAMPSYHREIVPVGVAMMYHYEGPRAEPPKGYVWGDGSELRRSAYPALAEAVGRSFYGSRWRDRIRARWRWHVHDSFKVPDLRNRPLPEVSSV